jgi:hypothetical protein
MWKMENLYSNQDQNDSQEEDGIGTHPSDGKNVCLYGAKKR